MPKPLIHTKDLVGKKIDEALTNFESTIGGREKVVESLSTLPVSAEIDYVIGLLADPRNDEFSLAQVCAVGGISVGKLLSVWKEASGMQAQLVAISKVSQYLPGVIEDVMQRALPQKQPCYRCEATGKVKSPKVDLKGTKVEEISCFECQGTGFQTTTPDLDTQKVAIQLGGFLQPKPVVAINQQFNRQENNAYFTGDDLRSFRSASDKLLYPGKERVNTSNEEEPADAEIIPDPKSK